MVDWALKISYLFKQYKCVQYQACKCTSYLLVILKKKKQGDTLLTDNMKFWNFTQKCLYIFREKTPPPPPRSIYKHCAATHILQMNYLAQTTSQWTSTEHWPVFFLFDSFCTRGWGTFLNSPDDPLLSHTLVRTRPVRMSEKAQCWK